MSEGAFEVGDKVVWKNWGNIDAPEFEVLALYNDQVWLLDFAGRAFTEKQSDYVKVAVKWELEKTYSLDGSRDSLAITVRWIHESGAALVSFYDLAGRLTGCMKSAADRKGYKEVV